MPQGLLYKGLATDNFCVLNAGLPADTTLKRLTGLFRSADANYDVPLASDTASHHAPMMKTILFSSQEISDVSI